MYLKEIPLIFRRSTRKGLGKLRAMEIKAFKKFDEDFITQLKEEFAYESMK